MFDFICYFFFSSREISLFCHAFFFTAIPILEFNQGTTNCKLLDSPGSNDMQTIEK